MSPSFSLLLMLFGAAFGAGLVDAIAGGGGLITIPVLLGIGLPPQVALGTNKLQASFGSGSAMLHFLQNGTVRLRDCRTGIVWTFAGSSLGVLAVQRLDPALLRPIIPWALAAIALYTIFSPKLGRDDVHARMGAAMFYPLLGLLIGFYDGFLGPGTGSFWAMAFMLLMGYSLLRATAYTKVMNFTSNISALLFFMAAGQVRIVEGLVMGVGQYVGAKIGARLASRKGSQFIRPIFITMVLAVLAKMIWQNMH